jgi:uncharacterized protein YrrD
MFHSFNDLRHFTVDSTDGKPGDVEDIYFDDESMRARFLIVDVGNWFSEHLALLDIAEVTEIDVHKREIGLNLTRDEIEAAPDPDECKPVSEQAREDPLDTDWPLVMLGPRERIAAPIGFYTTAAAEPPKVAQEAEAQRVQQRNPHLRSMRHMLNYRVLDLDDTRLGRIEDFLFEPEDGRIRYMVLDGGRILPGKRFVLAIDWVKGIDHRSQTVRVDVSEAQIADAPEPGELRELSRSEEAALYRHYNMPPYWL